MTSNPEFDSIRPYYDSEVPAAAERLCQSEAFLDLFKQLFKLDKAPIIAMLKKIKTKDQFQQYLFGPIVRKLMDMTTDGAFTLGCAVSATMAVAGHPVLGLFAAMPYLVVEYDDGREKQCNFKFEQNVDQLLEELARRRND